MKCTYNNIETLGPWLDGRLAPELAEPELFAEFAATGTQIAEHYEKREFSRAVREIMALADRANHRPPRALKQDGLWA